MASAKRTYALSVKITDDYGITRLVASVVYRSESGELLCPDQYGQDAGLRDLRVTAYIDRDQRRVWGVLHAFDTASTLDLRRVEGMAKVLRKLDRGLRTAGERQGYLADGEFSAYLCRVAAVLGIDEYYVRNSAEAESRSGQRWRRTNGAGVQDWVQYRMSELCRAGVAA